MGSTENTVSWFCGKSRSISIFNSFLDLYQSYCPIWWNKMEKGGNQKEGRTKRIVDIKGGYQKYVYYNRVL